MAHQSESACFRALFEPALQAYERMTGVLLVQHPLAVKLQTCDSVEAITGLLQDQAQPFSHLQGSDKIMKSLKTTVSILSKLSSADSPADTFGLVRQQELVEYHIFDCSSRRSPPQKRYKLVSLFYLTYVTFSSSYEDDLVTFQ